MDFGSIICNYNNPKCKLCPLKKNCYAFINHSCKNFPTKKIKQLIPIKKKYFLILKHKHLIWLKKQPSSGIWGGLFIFPQFDTINELNKWLNNSGIKYDKIEQLIKFRHTFSHFYLDITPIYVTINHFFDYIDETKGLWYNLKQDVKIGLATPIKNLLKQFKN